ncbi:hypothetical protein HUO09_05560 [Vibrio sp. Y2-5]|uniref:hypothetical protein n=1 Tax=Vibrio sp. Y2-5 TaxID=2743977 RepID=UPI0016610896|nr:hypothetical protein [Vibrio sp. Y2-5]MBD0785799.1 hypothetical protein [Vibrio sp. Y2-5]
MTDRVDYILRLEEQVEDGCKVNPALSRALIGCLNTRETSELLIYSIEHDLVVRDLVNRKIHFDLSGGKKYCYEELASKILEITKSARYQVALSSVMTLSVILPYLKIETQLEILVVLALSKWKLFRKRAYKFIKKYYKQEYQGILIAARNKFEDHEVCDIIIENFESEILIEERHFLADSCSHDSYISKLYTKIGETAPELVAELLEYDSCSYCYTLYKLGWSLESEITTETLTENTKDLEFLIWCLGRLGEWERIIDIYELR